MQDYIHKKETESICKHLNIFYRIISIINLLLTNIAVGLILLISALYCIITFIYGLDYEPAIRDCESILLLIK